jgi:hypothetical protein
MKVKTVEFAPEVASVMAPLLARAAEQSELWNALTFAVPSCTATLKRHNTLNAAYPRADKRGEKHFYTIAVRSLVWNNVPQVFRVGAAAIWLSADGKPLDAAALGVLAHEIAAALACTAIVCECAKPRAKVAAAQPESEESEEDDEEEEEEDDGSNEDFMVSDADEDPDEEEDEEEEEPPIKRIHLDDRLSIAIEMQTTVLSTLLVFLQEKMK